jgi:hypothetical protein
MVTRNHLDRDACLVTCPDRLDHLLPGWVDQADQPEEAQVVLERRVDASLTLRDRQHAKPLGSEPVEDGVGRCDDRRLDVSEQHLRGALHIGDADW